MKQILLLGIFALANVFFASAQTCGSNFYDSGGASGPYSDFEQDTTTLCPDVPGEMLVVNFSSFVVEFSYDTLFIYNGNSTSASLIGAYTGDISPGIVYGENPTGCLTFVFSSDLSITYDGWEASVTCLPFPSCPKPTNLTLNSIVSNTVDLSWIAGGSEGEWIVEFGAPGFVLGTGTQVTSNTNSITLSGLAYSTAYQALVRAICAPGDTSLYSNLVDFETEMNPFICGNYFYDSGGPSGSYGNNENDTLTICPTNANEVVALNFTQFDVISDDTLKIFNGNSVFTPLIGSYNGIGQNLGVIYSTSVDGCLSFIFESNGFSFADGWTAEIMCIPPITCTTPTSLTGNAISESEVELSWTANNGESEWLIEYGPAGFAQGSGSSLTATTNPFVVTGLNAANIYDFYIQSVCAVGDSSFFSSKASDTTFIAPFICGNVFYDEGGPLFPYLDDSQDTVVICPGTSGEIVTLNFTSFDVEQDYDTLFIYDGPDPSFPLIGAYTGTDSPGFVIAGTASGCLTTVFYSDVSVSNSGWEAQISCMPAPTCLKPTSLAYDSLSNDLVRLAWVNGGTETEWVIEYDTVGFVPGTGMQVIANSNPFDLTGLASGTFYDVYIRAICSPGDTSFYSTKLSFGTYLTCTDLFYDMGGPNGDYDYFEDYSQTICPTSSSDAIELVFNEIDVEEFYDFIFIYDGISVNSPVLTSYSGFFTNETVVASNPSGCLTVSFTSDDIGNYAGWDAQINCVPRPTCFMPSNLTVDSTSSSSAYLSWQAGLSETEWLVEYGPSGFQPGTGTTVVTSTNPFTLDNLMGSSSYEFYVRSICSPGDSSSSAGPIGFNTPLSPFICGNLFTDAGGTGGNYQNNTQDTIVICPSNVNESVEIIFSSFDTEQGYDTLYVYDGNSTSSPLIGTYSGTQTIGTISANNPSGCLTFVFASDGSTFASGWEAQITCVTSSFCADPVNINATNITAFSATLSWQAGGSENQWEVEYGINGFTPGTGTSVITGVNTLDLSSLDNATEYDVYIRAICSATDTSAALMPFSFSTLTPLLICGNPFFDNGGPNFAYTAGLSDTIVICPSFPEEHIQIQFSEIQLSAGDSLFVFDGSSVNAPLLQTYTMTSLADTVEATGTSGCLTFMFQASAMTASSGWESTVICINEAGINTLSANHLKIYPNPAQGYVMLENLSENSYSFTLSDIHGKEIYTTPGAKSLAGFSTQKIDISSLENGMYFIRLLDGEGQRSIPLIKQ